MQINIYKDKMLGARLFGAPALYSDRPIPREDVPQGWYCYDLRGTARHPDEPHALVDKAEENHAGSILSYLPLKNGRSQFRLVKDMFQMTGTNPSLAEFCAAEHIRCPETPLRHMLCPASPEDAGLFYAQAPERDEELGAVGHVRVDFGRDGKGFYHTWWPRGPEELNTQEFRDELDKVVNDLRKGILKDLSSMCRYWEMTSPLLGGSLMLNTGPAPLSEEDVYSLSQILQDDPHHKYYLSRTACLGILRRARERGKELPPQLKLALMAQAGLIRFDFGQGMDIQAYHINQRNEGIDLGGVSGALMRTQNMQMQTFVTQQCLTPWDTQQARIFTPESRAPTLASADGGGGRNPAGLLFAAGFCAGAGPSAGGIGYMEECSPTLKASESGTNMVPSVLCLNDQGGGVMACSEDVAGTLRAQEHGHQPLVMGTSEIPVLFENHGKDARYKGPLNVAPTVVTTYGTGGNNLPLVRMFSRQRVDVFKDNNTASTESARQHKDATDLVLQKAGTDRPLLIRRLTPLECERLQGFPDHWTDLPGASDSSRYKALGNSVAIPCVEYIMRGIVMAAGYGVCDDEDAPAAFRQRTRLSQHISFLKDFFRAYKDFDHRQIDTIELMLERLYKKWGLNDHTDFRSMGPGDYPTLSDLYNVIEDAYQHYDREENPLYPRELLQEVLLGLHSLCRGAESKFFNGHTNITSHRLLVFGVKELLHASAGVKNAMLFNLLSYLSDKLLTEGNTAAALDELYIWLSNPTAVEYIRNTLKRVRKKESSLIMASQNLEDFDAPGVREMTRPLFAIPTHQFLFNAGSVDRRFYMDNLQLEESEFELISRPQNGVCLFKCGNERYLLEVHAPEHKKKLFGEGGGR